MKTTLKFFSSVPGAVLTLVLLMGSAVAVPLAASFNPVFGNTVTNTLASDAGQVGGLTLGYAVNGSAPALSVTNDQYGHVTLNANSGQPVDLQSGGTSIWSCGSASGCTTTYPINGGNVLGKGTSSLDAGSIGTLCDPGTGNCVTVKKMLDYLLDAGGAGLL